jgi:hypothetical protein
MDFLNSVSLHKTNLSIEKAFHKFIDKMLCNVNDNMHIGGISWDLIKAFICASQELLLSTENW